MVKAKPKHEKRNIEFVTITACVSLLICIILLPILCLIPAIWSHVTIPNEIWDIEKILIPGIMGYLFGYSSGATPNPNITANDS